jgi:hypothetical protein
MTTYRNNQEVVTGMRSSRFTQRSGEWFLQTREGIELGPFESHAEAAVCLDDYVNFVEGSSEADKEQFFKIFAAA